MHAQESALPPCHDKMQLVIRIPTKHPIPLVQCRPETCMSGRTTRSASIMRRMSVPGKIISEAAQKPSLLSC